MIDERTIQMAANALLAAAGPGAQVILFGSYARGEARPSSDLDFLVIEPDVPDPMRELVRLNEVVAPLMVPIDVLVVSQDKYEYWCDTPNTVYFRAAREGRVYGKVA